MRNHSPGPILALLIGATDLSASTISVQATNSREGSIFLLSVALIAALALVYVFFRRSSTFSLRERDERQRLAALEKEAQAQRESAQRDLAESEARYRAVFANSPLSNWLFDAESFRFLEVNRAAIAEYGYTEEEFLSMRVLDIRPESDLPRFMQVFRTPKDGGKLQGNWVHRRKDGSLLDVEITSYDVEWRGRKAKMVIAHNITERLAFERQLIEWKRRYDAAISASGQVLYDWHPATNQITYSNVFERLGYAPHEMTGGFEYWKQLVHPEDRAAFDREIERVLATREPFTLNYRLKRKDGKYLHVEDRGRFFVNEQGRIVRLVGFVTDVTPRVSLERQLLQAQKMEAVGRLAGGVAHDFNNMLGVILGCAELITTDAPLPPNALRRVDAIKDASGRAATLTRQLLAFSRQQVLQPRIVNLNTVLVDMDNILKRLLGADIIVRKFLRPNALNVKVDPSQVEQVVMNLAVNARDAMPDGGKLTLETSNVDLDEEYCRQRPGVRPGSYVMLAVSDTGTGMDAATQARIFEPFFTTKSKDQGTGLGLATVHGIVSQSGGHIWLYSEPGTGTTFKIHFPATAAPVETVSPPVVEPAIHGGQETILLAEDEALYRDLIAELLAARGYRVVSASSGTEALEKGNSHNGAIDLLLTDAVMPGLNGKHLAQQLQPVHPSMRVIYMSGYTTNVVVHHGILDPGTEFLPKPFAPNALLRKVRAVLDQPA